MSATMAGLLAALWLAAGPAGVQPLGGPGESCRARSDCTPELRCIEYVCRESTAGEAAPAAATSGGVAAKPEGSAAASGWSAFALGGVHGFAGLALGPALTAGWTFGRSPEWGGGFLFALRGGVLLGRMEVAIEIAPGTLWRNLERSSVLSLNATMGGLLAVSPHTFWPLRFGLGVTGVKTPRDDTYMQGRLDLVGLVYQYGHMMFELSLFSPRFSSEFHHFGVWVVPFTLAATYAF
jgi:hypothetical protein